MRLCRISTFALASTIVLAGCAGGTNVLKKKLPDETRVIDGPSLALPPNFDLRPPREAADYESVLRAQKTIEAQSLITGVAPATGAAAPAADVPEADAWLVNKVGAQAGVAADPNVRADLESQEQADAGVEDSREEKNRKGLMQRWFGGGNGDE